MSNGTLALLILGVEAKKKSEQSFLSGDSYSYLSTSNPFSRTYIVDLMLACTYHLSRTRPSRNPDCSCVIIMLTWRGCNSGPENLVWTTALYQRGIINELSQSEHVYKKFRSFCATCRSPVSLFLTFNVMDHGRSSQLLYSAGQVP